MFRRQFGYVRSRGRGASLTPSVEAGLPPSPGRVAAPLPSSASSCLRSGPRPPLPGLPSPASALPRPGAGSGPRPPVPPSAPDGLALRPDPGAPAPLRHPRVPGTPSAAHRATPSSHPGGRGVGRLSTGDVGLDPNAGGPGVRPAAQRPAAPGLLRGRSARSPSARKQRPRQRVRPRVPPDRRPPQRPELPGPA